MATDDKNKIHDFIAFHVVSKSYSKTFFAFEKMGASKKSRKKCSLIFLKVEIRAVSLLLKLLLVDLNLVDAT